MNTKKQKTNQMDMLHGSIADKLLLFALPLAASSILQQLFNSADVAVVGRFAGSHAMAAVGANASVINLFVNLFVGLSIGANVVVANYIGQKKPEKIQESIHTIITIALISGVFLLGLGMVAAEGILEWMDTPADVLDGAIIYLRIYLLGMPFVMFYNFGAAILRSKGDTKRPLYSLIISGVINVILNLFLVIGFKMGVSGVAIATVLSNVVSAIMVLDFLVKEDEPYRLHLRQLTLKKEYVSSVVRIGLPAGIQGMVFSVANIFIQMSINRFGSAAIAGSTVALNFEYFSYFTINAFASAAVTFTSQNFGAGQLERCKKIFRYCMIMSVISSGVLSTTFLLGGKFFVEIYTVDEAVIAYALLRMAHVLVVEWMASSYEISGSALRGMGYSMLPAILTVIGTCVLRLCWIYLLFRGSDNFGLLMDVYPVSWAVTGIFVWGAYLVIRKKIFSRVKEREVQ